MFKGASPCVRSAQRRARPRALPDPAIVAAAPPPFKRADPAMRPLVRRRRNVQDCRHVVDAVGDKATPSRLPSMFPVVAIVPLPLCR
jgi:hypothetical protein